MILGFVFGCSTAGVGGSLPSFWVHAVRGTHTQCSKKTAVSQAPGQGDCRPSTRLPRPDPQNPGAPPGVIWEYGARSDP